jgi:hypothetical protein
LANNNIAALHQCESELSGLVDSLPVPEHFNEIILSCAPDVFLDVLMGNIRNSLISFQAWITKIRNERTSILINNLNFLKRDYTANAEGIAELERLLVQQLDVELTAKLRELKTFEHLYNEKPSPLFLTLLRSRATDDLQCIKKDDGSEFESKAERENFIVDFFADIYTNKKQDVPVDYTNCIENFLGQDIINNPVVQNSRITVHERSELESPLTLQELDESLADCNMRSAAGADGFSNKLIKACWPVLRIPLYNYALHCYNTGILTTNFRSACIKLILKKGDVSRP